MLDAIKTEEDEQQPGAPQMVPENPANTATTATAAAATAVASTSSPSLDEDTDLDAPILLRPIVENNNSINVDTRASIGAAHSPSQVLAAAAEPQDSTTTSDGAGGGDDEIDLAGMLLD
jgi:hypothetical protein